MLNLRIGHLPVYIAYAADLTKCKSPKFMVSNQRMSTFVKFNYKKTQFILHTAYE